MGYGTPMVVRPVAGMMAAPGVFTPVSDPVPFFRPGISSGFDETAAPLNDVPLTIILAQFRV